MALFRCVNRFANSDYHCLGRGLRMNIDLVFKIAGLGILISVFNMVLKQAEKEEQAQMLTLVGVIIVLMVIIQLINQLFTNIRSIFGF